MSHLRLTRSVIYPEAERLKEEYENSLPVTREEFQKFMSVIDDIKFKYKKEGKELDFKVLYGVEAYIVDDLKESVTNSKGQSLDGSFVVFDIETTGFSAIYDKIIEIGAVKVEKGVITERFSRFVNPQRPIPYRIEELTKINDSMVMDADT